MVCNYTIRQCILNLSHFKNDLYEKIAHNTGTSWIWGVPNKNLKLFNGQPLVSYSINTCLKISSDVYVSQTAKK